MRLFSIAICVALMAAAPMAAKAHWNPYRGAHHYGGRHRSLGPLPRDPLYIAPPRARCEIDSRDARGRLRRCAAARAAFEQEHPCPSTGQTSGPCPGYVVDHIIPLKRGGADDPSNMQWQTIADAKAKDRLE